MPEAQYGESVGQSLATIPIVDAHHHLWDLRAGRYGWLQRGPFADRGWGDWSSLRRSYLAPDFLKDAGEIRLAGSVHMQAAHDKSWSLIETAWVDGVASLYGNPTGIVCFVDLEADDVRRQLHAQVACSRVVGARQILNVHPDPRLSRAQADYLSSPRWRRNFTAIAEFGLTFDAQVYPAQHPRLAELARRYPETRIIVDHCGLPLVGSDEVDEQWRAGMSRLADCGNVFLKISGFGMAARVPPDAVVLDVVRRSVDLFGPHRVMFGSNFPIDGLVYSYAGLWRLYLDAVQSFSGLEIAEMFSGTARRVYSLDAKPGAAAGPAGV